VVELSGEAVLTADSSFPADLQEFSLSPSEEDRHLLDAFDRLRHASTENETSERRSQSPRDMTKEEESQFIPSTVIEMKKEKESQFIPSPITDMTEEEIHFIPSPVKDDRGRDSLHPFSRHRNDGVDSLHPFSRQRHFINHHFFASMAWMILFNLGSLST